MTGLSVAADPGGDTGPRVSSVWLLPGMMRLTSSCGKTPPTTIPGGRGGGGDPPAVARHEGAQLSDTLDQPQQEEQLVVIKLHGFT